jgi:uncharacterized protein YjiS (DUF1127 family)
MSIDIIYETEILGRSVSVNSRRTDSAELVRRARHDRAEVIGSFVGELFGDGLQKLGAGLKKVAYVVESWRQRRATFGELNALDDRLLADIGVRRADIPTIAEASGHRRSFGARNPSSTSLLTRSL